MNIKKSKQLRLIQSLITDHRMSKGNTVKYYRATKRFKRNYKFTVQEVHPSGNWLLDNNNHWHPIWNLTKVK